MKVKIFSRKPPNSISFELSANLFYIFKMNCQMSFLQITKSSGNSLNFNKKINFLIKNIYKFSLINFNDKKTTCFCNPQKILKYLDL